MLKNIWNSLKRVVMLNNEDFKEVIRNTNLFAFDLIIKNQEDNVLLAKRNNAPAKGFYFVPGGRVHKNENLNEAFARILAIETGLVSKDFVYIRYYGLYEHIYQDNVFEDKTFNTHYIIHAIEMKLKDNKQIVLDDQHDDFRYLDINSILTNKLIHKFVKNYFEIKADNLFQFDRE